MIKMILAVDEHNGIGKDNKLPWPFMKEDMKYFKEITQGNIVVMGSNTYKSLPMYPLGLPDRKNVVLSSKSKGNSLDWKMGEVSYINDPNFLITKGKKFYRHKDIFIIGGASVYKQYITQVEEIHLTRIKGMYECDTHFDTDFLQKGGWCLINEKQLCHAAKVEVWRRK